MKLRILAVAMAVVPLSLEAQAFGLHDCGHGQTVECYRKVHTPDLYTTRYKSVMVKPGWWETKTVPAVYGHHQKRVLVTPGQTVWHTQPAQWGVIHEQREVRSGYYAWVNKGGWHRHGDVICKEYHPPEVATVERKVLVAPEKRVAQHVPARYEWVNQPYMIRPAQTVRVYHPPVYEHVAERVLVQQGTSHLVPVEKTCLKGC